MKSSKVIKKVNKDKDELGVGKGGGKSGLDKPSLSKEKKLKNVQNVQEGNKRSADEDGKKAENKEENLKGGSKNGEGKRKSSEEEPGKSKSVEKGKDFSGDDDIVGRKDMPDKEGNKNQAGESKGDVGNDENKSNLNRETESEGDGKEQKGGSSGGKNEEEGTVVGPEKVPEETGNSVDECYFSIKCTDEENRLIACLRFPGNGMSYILWLNLCLLCKVDVCVFLIKYLSLCGRLL